MTSCAVQSRLLIATFFLGNMFQTRDISIYTSLDRSPFSKSVDVYVTFFGR